MPNDCRQEVVGRYLPTDRSEPDNSLSEEAVAKCLNWLAWHDEHDELTRRWQTLESRLIHQHNWFRLSETERNVLPEAAELKSLEDRLNTLFESKQRLLCDLPSIAAITAQGIQLKLCVAIACVFPDEHEEAHNLLKSTLADLSSISGIEQPMAELSFEQRTQDESKVQSTAVESVLSHSLPR